MRKIEFFQKHPNYRYAVLSKWINDDLNNAFQVSMKIPPHIIDEIIMKKFKKELGEHDALISCLLINSIMLRKNLASANKKIIELSESAQKSE